VYTLPIGREKPFALIRWFELQAVRWEVLSVARFPIFSNLQFLRGTEDRDTVWLLLPR
jgi:hypothetical protein